MSTRPAETPFSTLLEHARAQEPAALTALYRLSLPVVYRYVLLRVGDVHHAEDVTAETFAAVVASIASLRATDELGFLGWVLGIARHQVARHMRHRRTHAAASLDPLAESVAPEYLRAITAGEAADPLAIVVARERWSEVVVALERLTDEQREVVLLRFLLGYSTEEVGHLLAKPATAIRALQHRGLRTLARSLGHADQPVGDRRPAVSAHPDEGSKRHGS